MRHLTTFASAAAIALLSLALPASAGSVQRSGHFIGANAGTGSFTMSRTCAAGSGCSMDRSVTATTANGRSVGVETERRCTAGAGCSLERSVTLTTPNNKTATVDTQRTCTGGSCSVNRTVTLPNGKSVSSTETGDRLMRAVEQARQNRGRQVVPRPLTQDEIRARIAGRQRTDLEAADKKASGQGQLSNASIASYLALKQQAQSLAAGTVSTSGRSRSLASP